MRFWSDFFCDFILKRSTRLKSDQSVSSPSDWTYKPSSTVSMLKKLKRKKKCLTLTPVALHSPASIIRTDRRDKHRLWLHLHVQITTQMNNVITQNVRLFLFSAVVRGWHKFIRFLKQLNTVISQALPLNPSTWKMHEPESTPRLSKD